MVKDGSTNYVIMVWGCNGLNCIDFWYYYNFGDNCNIYNLSLHKYDIGAPITKKEDE